MFLNDGQIVDDNFLPIDSPERVYLWAKYVVKGKISLEKEQILYDSPRLIYFYSKLLIELEIPIPDQNTFSENLVRRDSWAPCAHANFCGTRCAQGVTFCRLPHIYIYICLLYTSPSPRD